MLGIEKAYGDVAIRALLHANYNLMNASVEDALRKSLRYGKNDTLGLDAIPEISIATQIKKFDQHAILVTEEQNDWPFSYNNATDDPRSFHTFFISDPTDRSKQFADFLTDVKNKNECVIEVMQEPKSQERWENKFSAPVDITGPYTAITCIRRGIPIITVMINYLTQKMYMACSAGIFKIKVNCEKEQLKTLTTEYICEHGEHVKFSVPTPKHQQMKRFVTFLGKEGYLENLLESQLMEKEEFTQSIFYDQPGGPSRVLYLSGIQAETEAIGFILANGEKIVEWIHWLTFVRFARNVNDLSEPILQVYEIWHPQPHTKDGILMSTLPNYSIFRQVDNEQMVINVASFQQFSNPSKIRCSLLICINANHWAQQVAQRYGYRKIQFPRDT